MLPFLYQKLAKSRLSDPIYGNFWSFLRSGVEFVFLSVSYDFLYGITLSAIDIDNIRWVEPFLPL